MAKARKPLTAPTVPEPAVDVFEEEPAAAAPEADSAGAPPAPDDPPLPPGAGEADEGGENEEEETGAEEPLDDQAGADQARAKTYRCVQECRFLNRSWNVGDILLPPARPLAIPSHFEEVTAE